MAAQRSSKKKRRRITTASWNVRSLVEDTGDPRVCRRSSTSHSGVDRKLDLLADELRVHGIDLAGIQETRWFGNDVWPAGACTFLHSGRPLPQDGQPARRNEGVGIFLNAAMTTLWKRGGEQWQAVSSRIVTARLLVGLKGDRIPGGGKRQSDFYLSVVNVYAPTSKATLSVKQAFFTDLQSVVSALPSRDAVVFLGDFNAHVGSCDNCGHPGSVGADDGGSAWGSVLGRFGLGSCNQAGEELLLFCATNQLSVMNTFFRKRPSTHGTWTHPATQRCHLIEFILMRSSQRRFRRDVRVGRGASCWTDHFMVRTTLELDFLVPLHPRLPVQQRQNLAVHLFHDKATPTTYHQEMSLACSGESIYARALAS